MCSKTVCSGCLPGMRAPLPGTSPELRACSACAPWQNVPACELCREPFGRLSRRRHHCRGCSKSVCDGCSSKDKQPYPVRLCRDCKLLD
jgi:hypothetical protein